MNREFADFKQLRFSTYIFHLALLHLKFHCFRRCILITFFREKACFSFFLYLKFGIHRSEFQYQSIVEICENFKQFINDFKAMKR